MDEKQTALLRDIKGLILEIWDSHDRFQAQTASKAEVDAFFKKIEQRLASAKARIQIETDELKTRLAKLEAEAEVQEPR